MSLSIDMQVEIAAPIERVWDAVASQEGMRGWFNPNITFEPHVGGTVVFDVNHGGHYRFGGKVVEVVPPTLISWEWRSILDDWPVATLLTFELAETEGGTIVTVRHHGWEAFGGERAEREHADFSEGWRMLGGIGELKTYVEAGVTAA